MKRVSDALVQKPFLNYSRKGETSIPQHLIIMVDDKVRI